MTSDQLGPVFMVAVLIGLIPAIIASNKGHNFVVWWLFGAAFFILALPLALLTQPSRVGMEEQQRAQGMRKCPQCAEMVKAEALKCRYCGTALTPIQTVPVIPGVRVVYLGKRYFLGVNEE